MPPSLNVCYWGESSPTTFLAGSLTDLAQEAVETVDRVLTPGGNIPAQSVPLFCGEHRSCA